VRAVVRRSQGHANSVLRLGPVELSLDRHEVRVNGQKLSVSRREFGVLELLFLKQGVILNKNAFLNHLYTGMEEPEMKTIDVIICRLAQEAGGRRCAEPDRYGVGLRLHPARAANHIEPANNSAFASHSQAAA
jgi:DNA-binding response OmpR family regulator